MNRGGVGVGVGVRMEMGKGGIGGNDTMSTVNITVHPYIRTFNDWEQEFIILEGMGRES